MKKIIAILLVFVVGFSAFAVVGTGDATLTLKTPVSGQLYHGFTSGTYGTGPLMKTAFKGSSPTESGNREVTIDFGDDNSQSVGYYNFYTTGNSNATVNFIMSPLSYNDGNSTYYVPYTLEYKAANDGASGVGSISFTAGSTTFGSAGVSTKTIADVTISNIFTAAGAGLRWRSIELLVDFDATDIDEFGLPETGFGFFSGSIIADVTAP